MLNQSINCRERFERPKLVPPRVSPDSVTTDKHTISTDVKLIGMVATSSLMRTSSVYCPTRRWLAWISSINNIRLTEQQTAKTPSEQRLDPRISLSCTVLPA